MVFGDRMRLTAEQKTRALVVLKRLLDKGEDEVCEYKANKSVTDNELGEYFSALSNEANLMGTGSAWIVFGIAEKPKPHIVHSSFKDGSDSINKLKHFIPQHTSDNTPFDNVYEIFERDKRIVMFEIPAAKPGTPMRFKNIAYGRNGDSISPLPDKKYKRVLNQIDGDWTAQIIPEATLDDFDPKAIARARELYRKFRPSMTDECEKMSNAEFLETVGATSNGKVSRAALILLGKWKSDRLLPTPNIRMRWNRWEEEHDYSDSEVYSIPFVLAVDEIVAKVFSRKREYITPGTVAVNKFETYDDFVLRESIQNMIAHRDYTEQAYITIREFLGERIEFVNNGSFIPGNVENVIKRQNRTGIRNPAMMELMTRLGMTEEAGRGISRMFRAQQERLFPMPEYDLSEEDWVKVTIYGKDIDMNYRDLLLHNPNLSMTDLYLLDCVQKNKLISSDDATRLNKMGFVIGRRPNYKIRPVYGTDSDAESVFGTREENEKYIGIIEEYILMHGSASYADIESLLADKFPPVMTPKQKKTKIGNLLRSMKDRGIVRNDGTFKYPKYVVACQANDE